MCLAYPSEIIKVKGLEAEIEKDGKTIRINLVLVPEAKKGDFVIIQNNSAIKKIGKDEAKRTLNNLQQIF